MFRITALIALLLASQAAFSQVDYSKAHPLISPYQGSSVWKFESSDFTNAEFPLAEVPGDLAKGKYLAVSGVSYSYQYDTPEGTSMIVLTENYKQALEDAGMELLFSCSGPDCGPGMNALFSETKKTGDIWHQYNGNDPVWLYRLTRDSGNAYVFLYFETGLYSPRVYQTVVEEKAMETGKVKVDPDYLAKQITNQGRVILKGLYFDTDSATLKPTSNETLSSVAGYLKAHADMSFYVVGHTDDTGSEQHNLDLSTARAESVANALIKDFGIAKDRLKPRGAGPWVPQARTGTSQTKEINRRVELVLSLPKS
ncbi:hypothetical protein BTA51_11440 [Hahella sp. CCB-MM4]|uniref:OmpA family protein n=1 Tax=Hahella sp. (strain CCB-MM4) TaxID=1926491 RepID=UPI000B9B0CCA|nr:OmpA family protein [Hahella sp. CCB-MM4]OZG73103.1 hypothetical protein BTA51_11440 [Hahella sp. CCB-MM4]